MPKFITMVVIEVEAPSLDEAHHRLYDLLDYTDHVRWIYFNRDLFGGQDPFYLKPGSLDNADDLKEEK